MGKAGKVLTCGLQPARGQRVSLGRRPHSKFLEDRTVPTLHIAEDPAQKRSKEASPGTAVLEAEGEWVAVPRTSLTRVRSSCSLYLPPHPTVPSPYSPKLQIGRVLDPSQCKPTSSSTVLLLARPAEGARGDSDEETCREGLLPCAEGVRKKEWSVTRDIPGSSVANSIGAASPGCSVPGTSTTHRSPTDPGSSCLWASAQLQALAVSTAGPRLEQEHVF